MRSGGREDLGSWLGLTSFLTHRASFKAKMGLNPGIEFTWMKCLWDGGIHLVRDNMKCQDCFTEISTEQHGKYFKRCPACYSAYKVKMARISLVPGLISFATSILYFWTFFTQVYRPQADRVHDFMLGIDTVLVGACWLFLAWQWGYTEVIHFRYEKKKRLMLIIAFLPLFLVMILSILLWTFL